MSKQSPTLRRRIAGNTVAGVLELFFAKLSNVIVFVALVRLLPEQAIAMIGVATGYLVIVSYLEVAPVRVLLRDYATMSVDRERRNRFFTGMLLFWLAQTVAMLFCCFGVYQVILARLSIEHLGILFLALTIDYISLTFQGWIQLVFYSALRQAEATRMSIAVSAARLAVMALIIWRPDVVTYAQVLVGTGIAVIAAWAAFFVLRLEYKPAWDREVVRSLLVSLSDYGWWDHLNRKGVETLMLIHTAILVWFASTTEVAEYSIALRFTSMLFLLPVQVQFALQVTLSRLTDPTRRTEVINSAIKLNAALSLAQLAVVLIAARPMLRVLFGHVAASDAVVDYTRIIAAGVAVCNLIWPLISVINNFTKLRLAFVNVFLPATVVGVLLYVAAAALAGAYGVAIANIAVYGILVTAMIAFVARNYPIKMDWRLVAEHERQMIQELLGRGRPQVGSGT
jgi:O-antigen/teichoic acid export membrane protein